MDVLRNKTLQVFDLSINYRKVIHDDYITNTVAIYKNSDDEEFVNQIRMEVPSTRRSGAALWMLVSDDADDDITLHIKIPLLINKFVSIRCAEWIKKIFGVRYDKDDFDRIEKKLGMSFHHDIIWLYPCSNPNGSKRKYISIDIPSFIFGRYNFSQTVHECGDGSLILGDGSHEYKYTISTETHNRKRGIFKKSNKYVRLEFEKGIRVPGKGQSAWDLDDDYISSASFKTDDLLFAIDEFKKSIKHRRESY